MFLMGDLEEVDDSEIFIETSVLVDFVQKASDADCFDIFKISTCEKVTSPSVEEEFRRKRENRTYIVRKFQEQIGGSETDTTELDIPHRDRFSESDEEYAEELFNELREGDAEEALKELSTRRTLFAKGTKALFDDEIGMLEVFDANLNPHLLGNLRETVRNRDDRKIIAEAADWANKRSKETLVSEDKTDIVGNGEGINRAISLTRGFNCRLVILTSGRFLSEISRA